LNEVALAECLAAERILDVGDKACRIYLANDQAPQPFELVCRGKRRAKLGKSEAERLLILGFPVDRQPSPARVIIDRNGLRSTRPFADVKRHTCIFEFVYFARPDSTLDGVSVYEARKNLGRELAAEHPVEADVVIPVPDSGVPATIGFAEASGIPFELGLVRSHYVGRTFIEPQASIRHFGVRLKLNPVGAALQDKRVVVVDDSIVRGTTSRKIVKMLRDAGAREVHMRISSPPTQWPCYYGIDTPTRRELIASSHSTDEIARYVTADTLAYLSLDGMLDAVTDIGDKTRDLDRTHFCHACFSGQYAIPFTASTKRQMRLTGV